MKNITITRTKNIANATYLPYAAYTRALALATELGGEIGKTDKGNFKATFTNAKTAEKFVKAWTAEYNANKKPSPAPVSDTHCVLLATSDGCVLADVHNTPAPKKAPRKSKGNGIDFTKFQGTKSEKNRALHATLVGMGIGDSRTKEYLAVWNARPWAK